jgi:hypothetical protein
MAWRVMMLKKISTVFPCGSGLMTNKRRLSVSIETA